MRSWYWPTKSSPIGITPDSQELEEGTFRQDLALGARYKADEFLRSLVEAPWLPPAEISS